MTRFLCLLPRARRIQAILAALAISSAGLWMVKLIPLNFFIFLVAPFYQLIVLTFLYQRFVRTNGREPIDVAFNWASGLLRDRVFALSNALLGLFLPFGLLVWATPVRHVA